MDREGFSVEGEEDYVEGCDGVEYEVDDEVVEEGDDCVL